MSSRLRAVLAASLLVLAVTAVAAFPRHARACELLNQLLVGCPPPAPAPGPPTPAPLPPLGDLPGVITLPTTPLPPPPPPPPPPRPGGRPVLVPEAARHLLDLANAERAAVGSQPLTSRPDVTEVASGHSIAMAERGAIWHNAAYVTDVVADLLQATWVRGENVAWSNDIDHAHRLLMDSPAHRSNMLDPRYSVAGFAVARSGDGNYWVTQNFLQPAEWANRDPAPAAASPGTPPPAQRAPSDRPAREPAAPQAPMVPDSSTPGGTAPVASGHQAGADLVPARALHGLDGAVLATDEARAGTPAGGMATLAAALVALVALGHGASWWSARARP